MRDVNRVKPAGPCRAPTANEEAPLLGDAQLVALCHGVYVDPKTTADARELIAGWYGEALAGLAGFFGPAASEPPMMIVCTSIRARSTSVGPRGDRA